MTNSTPRRVTCETKAIGKNLQRLRRGFGYSQQDIARVLGVSFQQVQKYEKGESRVSAEKLFHLKHFLDVPYAVFFEGVGRRTEYVSYDALSQKVCERLRKIPATELNKKALCLLLLVLAEG